MKGTDEQGDYTLGRVVQTSGDSVTYTLGTTPEEYTVEVTDVKSFSPGQQVKVYQDGKVLPVNPSA